MIPQRTAMTSIASDDPVADAELGDLRSRMLLDLELYLSHALTSRSEGSATPEKGAEPSRPMEKGAWKRR